MDRECWSFTFHQKWAAIYRIQREFPQVSIKKMIMEFDLNSHTDRTIKYKLNILNVLLKCQSWACSTVPLTEYSQGLDSSYIHLTSTFTSRHRICQVMCLCHWCHKRILNDIVHQPTLCKSLSVPWALFTHTRHSWNLHDLLFSFQQSQKEFCSSFRIAVSISD